MTDRVILLQLMICSVSSFGYYNYIPSGLKKPCENNYGVVWAFKPIVSDLQLTKAYLKILDNL
ncbi:MAG: hypothetical protein JETT_3176 [Candidatus Jettenia ecosi]|uniref:Uncharacterized protein n=1 Tax=Candidatus Jettenia ecosi TaxID=2494326 RepID=A0A533Q8K7_9BACT|nr:MAG: hypothetical protein JETT_3176 [Candidatus Jettenia ecosi]